MNSPASPLLSEQATSKPRKYRRPGLTTAETVPDGLKGFDSLPASAHVGQPVVEGLYDCSPATLWRRVKAGLIPKPRKFGRRTVWNVGDLREALQAK